MSDLFSLRGRVALVTGASGGFGRHFGRVLHAAGASVALAARRPDAVAADVASLGDRAMAVALDVTDAASIAAALDAVEARFGTCDLLVNNAGQGRVSTFGTTDDAAWREELELKFFSQIHVIRAFRPLLENSASPAIVGVNSLLALQPEKHMVATSAARAGVQSLLKSLATEFAPRIRVNSILLGLVDSGQWQRRFAAREDQALTREEWYGRLAREKGIPLQRLGEPEEPARAIVFLGSPAASYITGASLEVSGGVSRHI